MNTEIENIANCINRLIRDEVTRRVPEDKLESQVEELKWRYEVLLSDARDVIENFKSEGLTYGSLESEGYLRGILTATNLFKDVLEEGQPSA